jgi:hypothetical protein
MPRITNKEFIAVYASLLIAFPANEVFWNTKVQA